MSHKYYPANTDFDWFIYNPTDRFNFGINYDQGITNLGELLKVVVKDEISCQMTELYEFPGAGAECRPFGQNSSGCIYYDILADNGQGESYSLPRYTISQISPTSDGFPSWINFKGTTVDNYQMGNTPFFFSINPF